MHSESVKEKFFCQLKRAKFLIVKSFCIEWRFLSLSAKQMCQNCSCYKNSNIHTLKYSMITFTSEILLDLSKWCSRITKNSKCNGILSHFHWFL